MLDKAKVAELEVLLAKATPGPWLYRAKSNTWHRPPPPDTQYRYGESIMDPEDDLPAFKQADVDLIAATINALPALLRLARAVEWQPIETAPKDGETPLLLWDARFPECAPFIGYRGEDFPDDAACDIHSVACYPTHWMPMPATPATRADAADTTAGDAEPEGRG